MGLGLAARAVAGAACEGLCLAARPVDGEPAAPARTVHSIIRCVRVCLYAYVYHVCACFEFG